MKICQFATHWSSVWSYFVQLCSWNSNKNSNYPSDICTLVHTSWLITLLQEFEVACLDPLVLRLNQGYWAEMLAQDAGLNMAGLRHAGYRQFVVWRHGRLGRDARRVLPSCVVTRIRTSFPSPTGVYTGFRLGRLAWRSHTKVPHHQPRSVSSDQLGSGGRGGRRQRSFDAARIFRHHFLTPQDGLSILHPPPDYARLQLLDVGVGLDDLHRHCVPVAGLFVVHPLVPRGDNVVMLYNAVQSVYNLYRRQWYFCFYHYYCII